MKRFHWPLQKLLDVTVQKEQALEAALAALAAQIQAAQDEMRRRRESMKAQLRELDREPMDVRLGRQELFMRCAAAEEKEIEKLRKRSLELQAQRAKVMTAFLKVRQSRQTLERLRDESRQRHTNEQMKLEQNQLDEVAQTRHARAALREVMP